MRIRLDLMLCRKIVKITNWSKITKEDYFLAMERSLITNIELKYIIKRVLTDDINNQKTF